MGPPFVLYHIRLYDEFPDGSTVGFVHTHRAHDALSREAFIFMGMALAKLSSPLRDLGGSGENRLGSTDHRCGLSGSAKC